MINCFPCSCSGSNAPVEGSRPQLQRFEKMVGEKESRKQNKGHLNAEIGQISASMQKHFVSQSLMTLKGWISQKMRQAIVYIHANNLILS